MMTSLFCLLMAPLFFYYFLDLEIPYYATVILFLVWIISLILDMGITIQNRHLIVNHESNLIFRNLYGKFNTKLSILIQLSVETSFVLLMPFLFERTKYIIDLQASSIIAGIISVLHFVAYHYNRKTIKIIRENR